MRRDHWFDLYNGVDRENCWDTSSIHNRARTSTLLTPKPSNSVKEFQSSIIQLPVVSFGQDRWNVSGTGISNVLYLSWHKILCCIPTHLLSIKMRHMITHKRYKDVTTVKSVTEWLNLFSVWSKGSHSCYCISLLDRDFSVSFVREFSYAGRSSHRRSSPIFLGFR